LPYCRLLLPALAKARRRRNAPVACPTAAGGFALFMYDGDVGKIHTRQATMRPTISITVCSGQPLKAIRAYVGAETRRRRPRFTSVPRATASDPHSPLRLSSTAMLVSQLVLIKGMSKVRNPARTVVIQENYCLMNPSGMSEVVNAPPTSIPMHTWTASSP